MTREDLIRAVLDASPELLARLQETVRGPKTMAPACLQLIKMGEAARETRLSRATIWRAVKEGRLRAVEIRKGSRRIPRFELERFVVGR